MNIITGKGKEIPRKKPQDDSEKLDFKKIKINKQLTKEGDNIKVRVLSRYDYTTFEAHGSFNNKIYTTPCTHPHDYKGNPINPEGRCLYCEAVEKGFIPDDLKSKTRYIFAFYDLEMKMVRTLEVSYTQGNQLIDDIESYKDDLEDFAFELRRKGEGTKTSYTLNPILKLKGDTKTAFEEAADAKVDEELYEKVLYVKTLNQQAIDLENAGFEVEKQLDFVIEDEQKPSDGDGGNTEPDPRKVF